jgi:hypothetical protein
MRVRGDGFARLVTSSNVARAGRSPRARFGLTRTNRNGCNTPLVADP